jgi:hypothetical protein
MGKNRSEVIKSGHYNHPVKIIPWGIPHLQHVISPLLNLCFLYKPDLVVTGCICFCFFLKNQAVQYGTRIPGNFCLYILKTLLNTW